MKQSRLRWNRHIDALDTFLDNTLLPIIAVWALVAFVWQIGG